MLSFLSRPTRLTAGAQQAQTVNRYTLIYFVCGNPGLIEFYTDFFNCLRGLLDSSEGDTAYDIYGRNLLGFSDAEHEPFSANSKPWDLEGQIEGIYDDVTRMSADRGDGKNGGRQPYDSVILMGHSVGAYISVEIFHRHMRNPDMAPHLNLRHGMLLFPTLTSIGLSPSGKNMALLRYIPTLDAYAHTYARLALGLFSEDTVHWIAEHFMGFTPPMATLISRWLKSRDGVWQAIHLGQSELRIICEDVWDEALWEIAGQHDEPKTPKFFMLYGQDDHWVANHVRDDFIEKRREHGERAGRTKIEVDEGGLQHAFCTREDESLLVARKVMEWIEEIECARSVTI